MKPYNGTRNKHRTVNRDDVHHATQDAGSRKVRKANARRAKKAARQEAKNLVR